MSDAATTAVTVEPARSLRGRLRVPGDKSISHRYAILAALASGTSTITGYASGADCRATLRCLQSLGVAIRHTGDLDGTESIVTVTGRGLGALTPPAGPLDAGNSGTTLRLLAGVLAAAPFRTIITGDRSLQRRPMERIIEPLAQMGATLAASAGCAPITITGGHLRGIDYAPPVASAQVKSAVLLAGLHATGSTRVVERTQTRDHTERALESFGVAVQRNDTSVTIAGGAALRGGELAVPGDVSSAAFWAAAAAALPGSDIEIESVGLNPTRTAYLDVLRRAGAIVDVRVTGDAAGEPVGTLRVRHETLRPIVISPAEVPALIDELPVLGALAVHGGSIEVSGAGELRHKESDRIAQLAAGLRQLGARVDERHDGFTVAPGGPSPGGTVHGAGPSPSGTVDAAGDHRLAMAFAIAALAADGPSRIVGAEVVDVSYPGFFTTLDGLRHG